MKSKQTQKIRIETEKCIKAEHKITFDVNYISTNIMTVQINTFNRESNTHKNHQHTLL